MSSIDKMRMMPVILSEDQRQIHMVEAVPAKVVTRELGDGIVVNTRDSRHLSGKVVISRVRNTSHGKKRQSQFMPIDTALLQLDKVEDSIISESERIDQELTELTVKRSSLLNWLTLSNEEKTEISQSFASIAKPRERATNPFNIEAGERAAKMATLKDSTGRHNPSAILVQGQRLEKDLIDRDKQLVQKNLRINNSRMIRLMEWAHTENRQLDIANNKLDQMLSTPDGYDLAYLGHITRYLNFRVQPFNQLAYQVNTTGIRIAEPGMVESAQAGIKFLRMHNFLVMPFRILSSITLEKLDDTISKQADDLLPSVAERIEILEADENGKKYNNKLIGRLLLEATGVESALHNLNAKDVWQSSKRYKWMQEYHCLPNDDPELEVWYGHRL